MPLKRELIIYNDVFGWAMRQGLNYTLATTYFQYFNHKNLSVKYKLTTKYLTGKSAVFLYLPHTNK